MQTATKKGWADDLAPGLAATAGVGLLVGLGGMLSSLGGAHDIWRRPTIWILLAVAACLAFIAGTVCRHASLWRGVDRLTTACMAVAAAVLLAGTGVVAAWKAELQQFDSLSQKLHEMALLAGKLGKDGKAETAQVMAKITRLQQDIDALKTGVSPADFDRIISEAIARAQNAPPGPIHVTTPLMEPHVTPLPTELSTTGSDSPTAPLNVEPTIVGDGLEPRPSLGTTEEDNPPADTPGQPRGRGHSNEAQQLFALALGVALAAVGLPLPMVMAILGLVGQLFEMGVQVQDLGPIVQAVSTLHTKGGNVPTDEIAQLLDKTSDPKLAAQALMLITQQKLVREQFTREGRQALDRTMQATTQRNDALPERPKTKERQG